MTTHTPCLFPPGHTHVLSLTSDWVNLGVGSEGGWEGRQAITLDLQPSQRLDDTIAQHSDLCTAGQAVLSVHTCCPC